MENITDLENIIKSSFTQYAGAVIQSRAFVDVRDFVKPSARQIYYSLYTDGFTYDKPFKKTLKAIGSSMRFYIHGDASCEGIIMRSGQPFSMRYPLIEVEGSYGNLTESENWAAPRYTASRLSPIANYLLDDTKDYAISEWADNYDDTEKYPRVLASKGFYNIVNGSSGIAVGAAASIPQFNLIETNNALIKLLQNPDVDFDEIYCPPDFATGGTIINANEVKESIKTGKGKACVIQAKIEIENDSTLKVTELPYGVYANTICKEIQKLFDNDELDSSIVGVNDLTGENACIKIYLSKKSDPQSVIEYLYENTSLQKSYSINMTMLEDGKFPKVFGWKEALLQHLNHEKKIYINCYNHDLKKLEYRLKIVEAIIKAVSVIDEVINIVKNSESTSSAKESLKSLLSIDDDQAKAILDIKLARLAKLEVSKYNEEKNKLKENIDKIKSILNSEDLLKQEMINKFNEVKDKFGDSRRTVVTQKEIKKKNKNGTRAADITRDVVITYNPIGYLQCIPLSEYRKGNFYSFKTTTADIILLFSNTGKFYRITPKDIKTCGVKDKGTAIGSIVNLDKNEKIISVFSSEINESKPYLFFTMNNGIVKKSEKIDFIGSTRNLNGMIATKLNGNLVIDISESNGDYVTITTKDNYSITFKADEVRAMGRNAAGVKGINLSNDDEVVSCSISSSLDDNKILQKRGGKGKSKNV